jgi:hypothetical protein
MKHIFTAFRKKPYLIALWLLAIQLVGVQIAKAQLPDCITNTVVYGVFNQPSNIADSTEIRPINTTTGVIGALMGNRRYWIKKTIGGTSYYGTSGMALSCFTNKFYIITQMGNPGDKDIIMIDPVTPTASGTTISTITTLADYHFVKMAVSPDGFGYTVGVNRDTSKAANTFCPLVRFPLCGTAACATATTIVLGYLPSTGIMYKDGLFNGDIAFDATGNLYFGSSAFAPNTISKYTNTRLFKILKTDIPTVAGAGTIPMSLVADYTMLDSTGVSGLAIDNNGSMYFTLRRYTNANNASGGQPFVAEFWKSTTFGNATQITPFTPPTANFTVGDLATGYFPTGVLADIRVQLNGWNESGTARLKWDVNTNNQVNYYELQSSTDGNNFQTIAHISPENINTAVATYAFADANTSNDKVKYYRVRENVANGTGYYSNVVKVNFSSKVMLMASPSPNPFKNQFDLRLELKSSTAIAIKLRSESGATVYQRNVNGVQGANKITVDGLANLSKGIYIAEIRVDEETIREKLIKQ